MPVLKDAAQRLNTWLRDGTRPRIKLGMALQGGGSHGAYTWGVLDRLLQEPRVDLAALSGTSAGAMNAVVCAQGLARGGRKGARRALVNFWEAVATSARVLPSAATPWDRLLGDDGKDCSPALRNLLALTRMFSPYELNPLNINPLRDVVEAQIDFAALRRAASPRVFISATRVSTGTLRVFQNAEINADALLASACLPTLHHAIEIDGEPYWDGGYSGNPVVYPLVDEVQCSDVLLMLLSPLERREPLRSARDIIARASEISFNATFLREMQWLARHEQGRRNSAAHPKTRFHMLTPDLHLAELSQTSKLNADWQFLQTLHAQGGEAAEAWLARHRRDLGTRSSVNLAEVFGTA